MNNQQFRLDRYYRLAVACLAVPPLREHPGDIPLLVDHFLERAGHAGTFADVFPDDAMAEMTSHHWPGNVRELRNLVDATLMMGTPIRPAASAGPQSTSATSNGIESPLADGYHDARAQLLHDFEARYLTHLMDRTEGNLAKAARVAGVNRSHLFTLLRRHNMR